jgi:hypothetical protein
MALGVPGRLRSRIITTFGTTRVVGRQPKAPTAFTPGEMLGTHFQRLSRPQGTWFCRREPRKKIPSDTTGYRSRDRPASSAASRNQCAVVNQGVIVEEKGYTDFLLAYVWCCYGALFVMAVIIILRKLR